MSLYIDYFENMRPQTLTTTKLLVNGQGINLWVRVSGVLLYRPIGHMPPKKNGRRMLLSGPRLLQRKWPIQCS
jgi:hypothetical protein